MGKQNKNIYDLTGVTPVKVVSENLTKKGKLKGDKKTVRKLKSICTHHAINRSGKKVKHRIEAHGKNCTCRICQEHFRMNFYTDQEYDKAYGSMKEIASQAKFIAQAIGADVDTIRQVCTTNLYLDDFRKTYKNLTKVAQKNDERKKKKKRKKESNSELGSWKIK